MPTSRLPRLDRKAIDAAERAAVDTDLAEVTDLADRLAVASRIVNDAAEVAAANRPRRDAYALSLWAYEGHRTLNAVIGVNRTRWHEMRCDALKLTAEERAAHWLRTATGEQIAERAEHVGLRHYKAENANKALPSLAVQVAQAEAREDAARVYRDEAAATLAAPPHSWSRPRIATVMGRDPSRVTHIKTAGGAR